MCDIERWRDGLRQGLQDIDREIVCESEGERKKQERKEGIKKDKKRQERKLL